MSSAFSLSLAQQIIQTVRRSNPLVHVITNDVVPQFTANVLLALGAVPAMVTAAEEVEDFVRQSQALSINVGTLTSSQRAAILLAVHQANRHHIPWVLDPVAAGALSYRTQFCLELLALHPTAIRGNGSEIQALAQQWAVGHEQSEMQNSGRGPDSQLSSDSAVPAAQHLARQTGSIVIVTGATDYITDGQRLIALPFGHARMTRITGTGCALSSVVATCLAHAADPMLSAAAACAMMGVCGQHAARHSQGPGSFVPVFLDTIDHFTMMTFEEDSGIASGLMEGSVHA